MPQQDEDLSLPRSTIDRIITANQLPVPRIFRQALAHHADNFILQVSLQANLLCETDNKKTISHEHIITAVERMGFNYRKDLQAVFEENVNLSKMKPSRINKLKSSEFTIEQLKEQQDRLFENARIEYLEMQQTRDDLENNELENNELQEVDKKDF